MIWESARISLFTIYHRILIVVLSTKDDNYRLIWPGIPTASVTLNTETITVRKRNKRSERAETGIFGIRMHRKEVH